MNTEEVSLHLELSESSRAAGNALAALAHAIAAHALRAHARGMTAGSPQALAVVATKYLKMRDYASAQYWYELIIRVDPRVAIAHLNLAAIHSLRGDETTARPYRERAYALQRVFVEPIDNPTRVLLVLCAGRSVCNVPYESLLNAGRSTVIKYAIDSADESEDAMLPPFDVVFNAIGDADVERQTIERLSRFAVTCNRPLLNRPDAVHGSRRDLLCASLARLDDVVVAPCCRLHEPVLSRDALMARLVQAGIDGWPVLARPVATHGGLGLHYCEGIEALEQAIGGIAGPLYLMRYIDYRSADGHYRKYRLIYVDGVPHAYHLAISSHWMVHYVTSDMPTSAWKQEEERRFLADPKGVLGERVMAVVARIGRELELEFAGIDLSILPNGRALVFEANAMMHVRGEPGEGPLAYRNPVFNRIALAFDAILARKQAGHVSNAEQRQATP